MKKILIAVLIILLIVLAYFAIFKGLPIGDTNILSVEQIIDKNDSLTEKISQTKSLLERDFTARKESLSQEVSNLLEKKEEYFNLAKISTEGEISKANTEEVFLIEYLWTKVGNNARNKGVNIKMTFSSAGTGEAEMQNIAFVVEGQYVPIVEFLYTLEEEGLNFKFENFKMIPSGENLTVTFNVKNIRIKNETGTSNTTESNPIENSEEPIK